MKKKLFIQDAEGNGKMIFDTKRDTKSVPE